MHHGGYELKEKLKTFMIRLWNFDKGTNSLDSVDYPKYGQLVAKSVVDKEVDYGI